MIETLSGVEAHGRRKTNAEPERVGPSARRREWCRNEDEELRTRIQLLETLTERVNGPVANACCRDTLSDLQVVCDALNELAATIAEPVRPSDASSMAYVSWAYGWCRSVALRLQELVTRPKSMACELRRRAIVDEATTYVGEFLEPIHHHVMRRWGLSEGRAPGPGTRTAMMHARTAILSLARELERLSALAPGRVRRNSVPGEAEPDRDRARANSLRRAHGRVGPRASR